jgi:ketosteroid isomerase-like protein
VLSFASWKGQRGDDPAARCVDERATNVERIRFHLKHVCVDAPFALGASNTVAVEWDVEETDVDGVTYRMSGVTVIEGRRGKVVRAREYVFEQDVLARAWPGRPNAAARSDAE